MDSIKSLLAGLFTGLAAYLRPLSGDLHSLLAVFALNFLIGLLAGILINKEKWDFRKARWCFIEACVFLVLISSIFVIGKMKGNISGSLQCVSFVTYAVFYYYGVNILKNLKRILPEGSLGYRVVSFLYYLLSVEFVKKVPYLTAYLATTQGKEDQK